MCSTRYLTVLLYSCILNSLVVGQGAKHGNVAKKSSAEQALEDNKILYAEFKRAGLLPNNPYQNQPFKVNYFEQQVIQYFMRPGSNKSYISRFDNPTIEMFGPEFFFNVFWENIERVAPLQILIKWMVNTSRITDRHAYGKELIAKYVDNPGGPCDPKSAFHIPKNFKLSDNITNWEYLDAVLNEWFKANENTRPEFMCNRFNGLTCLHNGTCGCSENNHWVELEFPYVHHGPCFVDNFKRCTQGYHNLGNYNESRKLQSVEFLQVELLRMATPLPKTTLCDNGASCEHLIDGMNYPICWSRVKTPYLQKHFPFGNEAVKLDDFLRIRTRFHKAIFKRQDAKCRFNPELEDYVETIEQYSYYPEIHYGDVANLMRLVNKMRLRICDFRKGNRFLQLLLYIISS